MNRYEFPLLSDAYIVRFTNGSWEAIETEMFTDARQTDDKVDQKLNPYRWHDDIICRRENSKYLHLPMLYQL